MNLYKKFTLKLYSFFVIDASDDFLRFRKNLSERIEKLTMKIDAKISFEKLHYSGNREAAKISALWSGKTDKYGHLAGEEILTFNERQIIEQVKVVYSPLGKALENQRKATEDQGEKQMKSYNYIINTSD